jgi:hypothetical protein
MADTKKKGNSFPLRLPVSLRAELEALAHNEGLSINQFIVMAVAEKIVQREMELADELSRPSDRTGSGVPG